MNAGFSLTDVLMALFLMACVSLGLLKQLWHTSHLLSQLRQENFKRNELLNLKEITFVDLRQRFGLY
jgi:hypothetical protein